MTLPITPPNLALFISFMYQNNYAASTTNTYVSAIGYCHRLAGFHDPTKVFFIMEMLKGYGELDFRVDTRLPITIPILKRILKVSSSTASIRYWTCLFNAMCTTALFAFLRIGEVTTTPYWFETSLFMTSMIVFTLSHCHTSDTEIARHNLVTLGNRCMNRRLVTELLYT